MKKILIGAGAAIIKNKKLLLTKRLSNKKLFPNFWTFPAGGYEETDELLENTAIREVKEEVGLNFKPTKKLNFYEYQNNKNSPEFLNCSRALKRGASNPRDHNEDYLGVSHVYLGEWSGKVIFQKEEISEIGWFTYEETKVLDIAFAYKEVIEDLHKFSLI